MNFVGMLLMSCSFQFASSLSVSCLIIFYCIHSEDTLWIDEKGQYNVCNVNIFLGCKDAIA